MGLLNRLSEWIEKKREEILEARIEYEKRKAERYQRKIERINQMKPGAIKAIREGLLYNKTPLQVMREEWERRKREREKKFR